MRQADVFLQGEGAAWYERNKDRIDPKNDPILKAIGKYHLNPKRVLEVGCANGWRLKELQKKYKCEIRGIDPSANLDKSDKHRYVFKGTASDIDYFVEPFDLLIYGWCLYLCDPEDYFEIATQGDRVLADGGHLIIYDFYTDFPHKRPYKHKAGLFSHKMDFSKLWSGHPAYSIYARQWYGADDDLTNVTILKKDMKSAFPVRE